jgi:hypothetical protein
MSLPVLHSHYNNSSLPRLIPPEQEEFIDVPIKCIDGETVLYKKIKKPKIVVIGVGDCSMLPKQKIDLENLPDIIYAILNIGPPTEGDPIDADFDWEDILDYDNLNNDIKDLLDIVNSNRPNNDVGSEGGSGEKIDHLKEAEDDTIKDFINVVKRRKTRKIIKEVSNIIHAKKAVVEMMIRPHKVLDYKKIKKKHPSVYALIDSYDSYYSDKGKFLNSFAETCTKMGISTWRAEKLTKNFYKEDNKDIRLEKINTHLKWAEFAEIKKGSLVIFVGDGCLLSKQMINGATWKDDNLKEFNDKYNPVWIQHFGKGNNCGCRPKKMLKKLIGIFIMELLVQMI